MYELEKEITERIYDYENPKRIAFSRKYPRFKKPIIFLRQMARDIKNFFDCRIKYERKNDFFDYIVVRHQSVLRRRLGDSDPKLQEQKNINLKQAIKRLNGVVIQPYDIFSLWKIINKPRYENGYVDGMLLSNGRIIKGLGGGYVNYQIFYTGFSYTPRLKPQKDIITQWMFFQIQAEFCRLVAVLQSYTILSI